MARDPLAAEVEPPLITDRLPEDPEEEEPVPSCTLPVLPLAAAPEMTLMPPVEP
jgi:hypothetical protein